jgi:glycopeptide antibiotics resistance protein
LGGGLVALVVGVLLLYAFPRIRFLYVILLTFGVTLVVHEAVVSNYDLGWAIFWDAITVSCGLLLAMGVSARKPAEWFD